MTCQMNGQPTRDLPEITLGLERTLADLCAATATAEAPSDLWITFSACQRSVAQLGRVLEAIDAWLGSHPDGVRLRRDDPRRVGTQIAAYASELDELSRRRGQLAESLARLS